MRVRVLLSAVAIVAAAAPASAQVNIESVLVGFTSGALPLSAGFLAFSAACQAEFPKTRMCNTQEVLETRQIPNGLSGEAWVRAKLAGPGTDETGFQGVFACTQLGGALRKVSGAGVFTEVTNCGADSALVACCGLPIDPAQGDLDQDGAATVLDATIFRRMLAGEPVLISSSP